MNVALRRPMSLDDFLDWEERQELRYEFDGFQPVAMTGGTSEHSAIQRNLIIALANRLRAKPCQVHGSELKIAVAGSIRYPDAFVVCSSIPRGTTVVTDPVVVFEVLSSSTSTTDRIVKKPGISRHAADPALRHAGAGPLGGHRVRPCRRRLGRACGVRRRGAGHAVDRHRTAAGRAVRGGIFRRAASRGLTNTAASDRASLVPWAPRK